jgi:hypothetical protein
MGFSFATQISVMLAQKQEADKKNPKKFGKEAEMGLCYWGGICGIYGNSGTSPIPPRSVASLSAS